MVFDKEIALYIARKVLKAFTVIIAITAVVFTIVRVLPGDPYQMWYYHFLQQGYPDEIAKSYARRYAAIFYEQLKSVGIDVNKTLPEQFLGYLTHVLRFDFGYSLTYNTSVTSIILGALPWTIFTVGVALVLQFVIGIAVGMVLAYKRGTKLDSIASALLMAWRAVPDYVVGLIMVYLVLIYVYHGDITELQGTMSPDVITMLEKEGLNWSNLGVVVRDVLGHAMWPILTYVIVGFAGWALAMRSSAINVLGEDYVTVAEARGLPDRRIAFTYVGRNAVLPLFTSLMICLGYAFGGSMFIEWLFQYQGMGYWIAYSVWNREYMVLSGCLLVESIAVVIAVHLADILYGLIDPRVRG